ncbi:glutamate ABC transporter substrate-binding protein [Kibdelosporangium philippinense]|uniref:Glutamate ABC transporter substrate-binding protein n=1 Tax=Kibdelosporangium philippinense TaxID=211113 RepID=A0ABS8ZSU1_9PSEU|nr:glutamate ABC transporter substrate-binding protein [Kibdelosporangium philippinense]MCE7009513.1 glutamate ABC transporter substrate-binding protein [Kibdelosporangium philippinense]
MRVRTLAVGLLVGGLALTACGKEGAPGDSGSAAPQQSAAADVTVAGSATFDKMKARGKVVIGVKEDQPGLGYKDPTTGKFSGFDIEIGKLVAAKLGFDPETKIEYKVVQSAGREAAIANGDVDYYVGTYTINARRKEQINFAGPYFTAGQDLLVRKDNTDITGPETLKGKKVCSISGSTPIQKVKTDNLTEPNNIVELQSYSQCVTQLEQKAVDAVTTDDAILKGYAAREKDKFKVVGKTFSSEPYGIGLPKTDAALKTKVTEILQTALDDGTWQNIYNNTLGQSGSPATKPVLDKS